MRSPLRRFVPALALAVVAGACDRLPEAVIVPEYDFTFSFEDGLQGWTQGTADLAGAPASVENVADRGSAGSRSARFFLDNAGGAGKVWITRELDVTPDKSYTAEITLDLGIADAAGASPWKVIAGLRTPAPVTAAELTFQDETARATAGSSDFAWVAKRYTVPAKADSEGRLFLTVGVWGTTTGARSYWLDNVKVVLTRS